MTVLVKRCSVPFLGAWCWEFRQNGYYNSGLARTKVTAHMSALAARVDYRVRRAIALKLRAMFLRTARGVLSNQELLFPF